MARKKTTPEEIKLALKKEIIRLGIEDNPSRTVYQKQYERGTAPSPNNAMKITGMKWQDLMQDIGFDYNGRKNSLQAALSSESKNTRNSKNYNFNDPLVRKEFIERAVTAMYINGYTVAEDLWKNLKNDIDVSYKTLIKHGITWDILLQAYKSKYNKAIIGENKVVWSQFTNKELLDIVTNAISNYNITSINSYRRKFNKNKNFPTVEFLNKRFGTTDKELWRMIQINGDLPIK